MHRFKKNNSGAKSARKASKKTKTIAGVFVWELNRKLPLNRFTKHVCALSLYEIF